MKFSFVVSGSNIGQRLDFFLSSRLKDFSRSLIQKSVRRGDVKVGNLVVVKNSHLVKKRDKVEICIEEYKDEAKEVVPTPMPIDIIYQDKDVLVVNKDIGVPVHPAKGNWENTLINGLVYKFKRIKKVGKSYKLGLIHRIDKETSGLVLIALNNKSLWYFSRQFEQREVEKYYLAVVRGNVKRLFKMKKRLMISNYIGRHPKYRKRMAVVNKEKGKVATTNFYFLNNNLHKNLGEISMVLAELITGRTHQIRLHLSHIGFPVIGDKIYGNKKYKRMMLHAFKIKIRMLNRKVKAFEAPIPSQFYKLFNIERILKKILKV